MSAVKLWYLNKNKPVLVLAQKKDDITWYLPELNINVDGADLFRTPVGVLRALKRNIENEIKRREQKLRIPHPNAEPTKYGYLWVIKGNK